MTDPANISSSAASVLVCWVGSHSINASDYPLYDGQWELIKLLLSLYEKPFVVDEARIAFKMEAKECMIVEKRLCEDGY